MWTWDWLPLTPAEESDQRPLPSSSWLLLFAAGGFSNVLRTYLASPTPDLICRSASCYLNWGPASPFHHSSLTLLRGQRIDIKLRPCHNVTGSPKLKKCQVKGDLWTLIHLGKGDRYAKKCSWLSFRHFRSFFTFAI